MKRARLMCRWDHIGQHTKKAGRKCKWDRVNVGQQELQKACA